MRISWLHDGQSNLVFLTHDGQKNKTKQNKVTRTKETTDKIFSPDASPRSKPINQGSVSVQTIHRIRCVFCHGATRATRSRSVRKL